MEAHDHPAGVTGGVLAQAVADAVVRSHRQSIGRGASQAQALFRHNVIVVVMRDALTRAEATLVATGQQEAVLDHRRRLQQAMRPDLVAAVERLTGARVEALMSATNVDPDMATEVFVLDRPVSPETL